MGMRRFIGIDLAWGRTRARGGPNETGVAVVDGAGTVIDCGWTRGVDETVEWITRAAAGGSASAFVDAPLVVGNPTGQRPCEREVGRRYGRWKVSANSTNLNSRHQAGVLLRELLEEAGWAYDDGTHGPPVDGLVVSECYPYTTLVGAVELGYDQERPRYKRQGRRPPQGWRLARAQVCDGLIAGLAGLAEADPPLLLASHPVSRRLMTEPSPEPDAAYKHREDLVDALVCAWTAALWSRHGLARCQVLGEEIPATSGAAATIIAPARPEQRRARAAE